MTATNPHPLANPLNQSRFRNFEFGQSTKQNSFSRINTSSDSKELTVPDPIPFSNDSYINANPYSRLTVPNSDILYYDGPIPTSGFLGQSPLFKLADGSVIDMKNCKIIYDPNTKWKAQGYWNDPNLEIKKPEDDKEWGKTETIESMLNKIDKNGVYEDPNLSPESIRYWNKAKEESQKLEQNLTDEQKQLLLALNSGQMFPLSKLIEEK